MNTWAVLATGPSMSQAVADQVRGRVNVVAVSDAFRIAPWANALASTDFAWWNANPDALEFRGAKYGAMADFQRVKGVERFNAPSSTNSGLLGLMVAVSHGAKKVLLCGIDLHSPGSHYFGEHGKGLKSSTANRMDIFKKQFARYHWDGVEIINCSPGSALKAYPFGNLENHLC